MLLRPAVIGLNHGRTYSQFARDGRNPGDSCKGARESRGREDYGVQSTEDRGETGAKVQIGAELLCKGAKVEAGKITEYGVRITDLGGMREGRGGGGAPVRTGEPGAGKDARRAQASEGRSTIWRG